MTTQEKSWDVCSLEEYWETRPRTNLTHLLFKNETKSEDKITWSCKFSGITKLILFTRCLKCSGSHAKPFLPTSNYVWPKWMVKWQGRVLVALVFASPARTVSLQFPSAHTLAPLLALPTGSAQSGMCLATLWRTPRVYWQNKRDQKSPFHRWWNHVYLLLVLCWEGKENWPVEMKEEQFTPGELTPCSSNWGMVVGTSRGMSAR